MRIQTVFRAGNSNVVAIPKEFVNDYGYEPGLQVMVNTYYGGDTLMIKKVGKNKSNKSTSNMTHEFRKWIDNTLDENSEILDELA